jgi:hypothetical protein
MHTVQIFILTGFTFLGILLKPVGDPRGGCMVSFVVVPFYRSTTLCHIDHVIHICGSIYCSPYLIILPLLNADCASRRRHNSISSAELTTLLLHFFHTSISVPMQCSSCTKKSILLIFF